MDIGQGWVFLCELDRSNNIASRGIARLSVNINIYPNDTQFCCHSYTWCRQWVIFMLCYSTLRNQCWFFSGGHRNKIGFQWISMPQNVIYIYIYQSLLLFVMMCDSQKKHDRDMIMTPQTAGCHNVKFVFAYRQQVWHHENSWYGWYSMHFGARLLFVWLSANQSSQLHGHLHWVVNMRIIG